MSRADAKVLDHFENIADAFDNIYEGEQPSLLYRLVDVAFRKSILDDRLKITLDIAGDVKGKEILDIGCGSGRYSVLLAKNRPSGVLGVDISPVMIEYSKRLASAHNVSQACVFEQCDFMQKQFNKKFNIIIAAGVFDYTEDPKPYLNKIKGLLNGRAILSFPVKWTLLTPVRVAWLFKRKCPNYYYSTAQLKRLFDECGLKIERIHKVGTFLVPGNYIVSCSAKERGR